MRLVVLLLAGVLAACGTTACTTVVEGTPSAPTGVLLPPRPREIRLDGVDPCSLLTPEQRAALGLGPGEVRSERYVELFRGSVRTCTAVGFSPDAVGIAVGLVTSVGIDRWQDVSLAADLRPTTLVGFPAVVARPTRFTDYCSVEVDVADGQMLDVQFRDGGNQPPLAQEELCTRAERSATELMRSLMTR